VASWDLFEIAVGARYIVGALLVVGGGGRREEEKGSAGKRGQALSRNNEGDGGDVG